MTSQHTLTATVTGASPISLKPTSASITLDESWSPYCQATIECPATSRAQLAALDPRTLRRVRLDTVETFGGVDDVADLTFRFGGAVAPTTAHVGPGQVSDYTNAMYHDYSTPGAPYRPPVTRSFDLHLRSRRINHATGTVTLELASDEAILDDSHRTTYRDGSAGWIPGGLNVLQSINWLMSQAGIGGGVTDSAGAGAALDRSKFPDSPDKSRWDHAARIAQFHGLRLWCDEKRVWHLRPDTPALPGPTVALSTTTNLVDAEDTISRDDGWCSGVVVIYTDPDTGGKSYDFAYVGSQPVKMDVVEYAAPYPGPGAAARIFQTRRQMGHVIPVRTLIDYTVAPGRAVSIDLPSTTLQNGPVSAVTYLYPDDEMTVRTRDLVDTSIPPTTEYTPLDN